MWYATKYIFQDNILRLRLLLQGSQTLVSYFLYGNAKQNCHHHEHYHEHHHEHEYAHCSPENEEDEGQPKAKHPYELFLSPTEAEQHCYCEHLNICYCCEHFRI